MQHLINHLISAKIVSLSVWVKPKTASPKIASSKIAGPKWLVPK